MWINRVSHFLEEKICGLSKVFHYIAVSLLAVMMVLTVVDVLMRYLFKQPILGAYELTELTMGLMIFFALAYTQVNKRHVSVDLVMRGFSKRVQGAIDSIIYLIGLGFFSLIIWRSVLYANVTWLKGDASVELSIPTAPFVLAVAVSSGVLCLVLLTDFTRSLAHLIKK